MRRIVLIGIVAFAALAAVPVAGAIPTQTVTPVTVHVSPGTGGPRTTFRLNWRNPTELGAVGSLQRSESINVSGPRVELQPKPALAPVIPQRAGVPELFITPDQLNRYTASSQKIFEELFQ